MTSIEDPGTGPSRGSQRFEPGPSAPQAPGRLVSRVVPLAEPLDPLDLAGEDGFVWRSAAGTLVGTGVAARVPVGTGPGRIERAAETVATLLAAAEVDDPDGGGLTLAAVGALPFHPANPGELVVPSVLLRTDPEGRTWAVLTEPGEFEAPSAGELVRRRAATRAARWPRARRLDTQGLWTGAGTRSRRGLGSPPGGLAPSRAVPAWTAGGPGCWRRWRRSGRGGWTRSCSPGRRRWRRSGRSRGPSCCGG